MYEVAHWFEKRFRGECRAPEAWKILRLVFLKKPDAKPDAKLEKGLRGFRALALLRVFSKWYTTVLVDMLHEEKSRLSGGACTWEPRGESIVNTCRPW